MQPADPYNFDKGAAFLEALNKLSTYSTSIGLPIPNVDIVGDGMAKRFNVRNAKCFGLYTPHRQLIEVNVGLCRNAVKVPFRSFAFPGHKTDLTPPGVLAHEWGHHIDEVRQMCKQYRPEMRDLWATEGCVSSYCPVLSEWFAETFRVHFLNPDLLRCAKPATSAFLVSTGLPFSHQQPWQVVLQHAHPRLLAAVENFIKNRPQNRLKRKKA